MKILFLGDIVGNSGREAFAKHVPGMRRNDGVDVVIANAENAAGGSGITENVARELFSFGCDVITLGDHVWDKREVYYFLNASGNIVRPANFVSQAPGRGVCVIEVKGVRIAVVTLLGRTFMKYLTDCPFRALDAVLGNLTGVQVVVVDMHAEATSEKVAMGWYADGRVSAVLGTHTHIQTADEKILPKGTAYITDAGMTGPYDSVIGQIKERIIDRYLTGMPNKFEVSSTPATLCGVIVDVDPATGRALSIVRVQKD
ncbi:MAG: TIGR00282 family metallophosphoesterase [Candidatus Omnitrophota bacterium]